MEIKKYQGKKFIVTIDRGSMYRRYVLKTIESNGKFLSQNDPLYKKDFESHYGFSPEWPHKKP